MTKTAFPASCDAKRYETKWREIDVLQLCLEAQNMNLNGCDADEVSGDGFKQTGEFVSQKSSEVD